MSKATDKADDVEKALKRAASESLGYIELISLSNEVSAGPADLRQIIIDKINNVLTDEAVDALCDADMEEMAKYDRWYDGDAGAHYKQR